MKPVRYNTDDDQPEAVYVHENGYLVKWDDYAALAAENERLRKAADNTIHILSKCESPYLKEDAVAAWNAAKKGRDAK